MKNITIIDKDYKQWVKALAMRYRQCQIRAAVKVNTEQILFNLSLGKDIHERQVENKYGSGFFDALSRDLKEEFPGIEGLSTSNLRYCEKCYLLYNEVVENLPQVVGNFTGQNPLESSSQPIAISSYELEKFYPVKVEGAIPSIEEIEARLNNQTECS